MLVLSMLFLELYEKMTIAVACGREIRWLEDREWERDLFLTIYVAEPCITK